MASPLSLIDYLSNSYSHTKFNAAVIDLLARDREITVYCESDHAKALEQFTSEPYKSHGVVCPKGWSLVRELLFPLVLLRNRKKDCLILGASGVQSVVTALMVMLRIIDGSRLFYVVHSELESLRGTSDRIKSFFAFAARRLKLMKRVKCAVLAEHILEAPEIRDSTFGKPYVVPHPPPIPYRHIEDSDNIDIRSVAIVGLIRRENKDIERINEFAALSAEKGIKVIAMGRQHVDAGLSEDVVDETTSYHYSESSIEEKLKSVDAILCIYNPDHYALTASGGALDWVTYGKPGLFLDHPCFEMLKGEDIPIVIRRSCAELLEEISTQPISFSKRKVLVFHQAVNDRFELALHDFLES